MVACFINDMNKDVYYITTSSLTSETYFYIESFLTFTHMVQTIRRPFTKYLLNTKITTKWRYGQRRGGLRRYFFPCRYLVHFTDTVQRRAKCWTNPSSRLPPEAPPSASLIGCTVQCDLQTPASHSLAPSKSVDEKSHPFYLDCVTVTVCSVSSCFEFSNSW